MMDLESDTSSDSEGPTHGTVVRNQSSDGDASEQRISWQISSGLARLYSILTQAEDSIIFNNSDSDDEEYMPRRYYLDFYEILGEYVMFYHNIFIVCRS